LIIIFALLVTASGVSGEERTPVTINYDRVLPLSGVEQFDGSPTASPVPVTRFRQAVFEFNRAAVQPLAWSTANELRRAGIHTDDIHAVPLALLNTHYQHQGVTSRAFAVTALKTYTYRGGRVIFRLAERHYLSNDFQKLDRLVIDFDDGHGFAAVAIGSPVEVNYSSTGTKNVRVKATLDDSRVLFGWFDFRVLALAAPLPHDTLSVTATIPYNSEFGTGEAYVYLAPGHSVITNPIVMLEGFDLGNSMNWDELYALLNKENLLEDLRADGYDAVVFNFANSIDPIQKNAFATIDLLNQVQTMLYPQQTFTLIGASMGGLVGRYALAYMESNTIPHHVATYMSFDTPHKGANIPLGIQYWVNFFAPNSTEAANLLSQLSSPAARQMLVYFFADPASSSPSADPLRAVFESDLATVGNYPSIPRKVAVANGSGGMQNQGFAAGAQLIDYNANIILATVKGNVWAVPDGGPTQIFEGQYTILFGENRTQDVTVSGTLPYDSAPGGSRNSMAQMDSTAAPVGDIVALHDSHCFIPTISALDLGTSDLFFDIAGEPSLLSMTPFDAVYFPTNNQPHVDVTAENAVWLKDEIGNTATAVAGGVVPRSTHIEQNYPNPFNPTTTIRFTLESAGPVRIIVYDTAGKQIAKLIDEHRAAGPNTARWDGRDDGGHSVSSGIYFYRLTSGAVTETRKMVLLK